MDFGMGKKAESHDQIYGEWTPIDPQETQNTPSPINILEEITKSDLEDEEEKEDFSEVIKEEKPRKRFGHYRSVFQNFQTYLQKPAH